MNAAGYLLRRSGVTVSRVAEEAGVLTSTVSQAICGHRRLTENTERAIRRLLPKYDADRVIALADEEFGARRG